MWPMKQIVSKTDLATLAAAIDAAEAGTSGEIRVVLRHTRHWNERRLSVHEIALKEFHRLGMQKTRDRTGVLILILFGEQKFQIIADEGIHRKVASGTWERVAERMAAHFREQKYVPGISDAVSEVGAVLAEAFPRKPGDTNELPNDIIER
jgi:uncharacterized membrane protein